MTNKKEKKTRLDESAVRRWMQMGGNDHLTDAFLTKLQENVLGDEETPEELPPADAPELSADDSIPPEGVDDLGVEGGLSLDPAAVEQLVKVIADAISAATGTEVGVSGSADEPAGELPPPGEETSGPEGELPPEEPLEEKVDVKAYKGDMKDQKLKPAKTSKKNTGPLEEEVDESLEEGQDKLEEVEDLMENVVSRVMDRVLQELRKKK